MARPLRVSWRELDTAALRLADHLGDVAAAVAHAVRALGTGSPSAATANFHDASLSVQTALPAPSNACCARWLGGSAITSATRQAPSPRTLAAPFHSLTRIFSIYGRIALPARALVQATGLRRRIVLPKFGLLLLPSHPSYKRPRRCLTSPANIHLVMLMLASPPKPPTLKHLLPAVCLLRLRAFAFLSQMC